jgi:hypothetical protein
MTYSCFRTKSLSVCNGFIAILSCIVGIGRADKPAGALNELEGPMLVAFETFEFRGVTSSGVSEDYSRT